MTSPRTALQRLRAVRNAYGAPDEREKRLLLRQLRTMRLATCAELQALHEDLLFICAFPGTPATRSLARRMLAVTAARLLRLPRTQQARADDSGMAGSTTRHVFPYPLVRWLSQVAPMEVEVDWRNLDDPTRLDTLVGLLLGNAEREGFESGEFATRDWIRLARRAGATTDLAWLVKGATAMSGAALWREAEWDGAEVPVAWQLRDSRWSATRNVVAGIPLACRSGMRKPAADAVAEIGRPLHAIERLSRPRARQVIASARAALAARCREVNAMTYPNVDEVWWCDLGEGAALAVIGIVPEQRLTLEANTGYLLFANGVPIGYGGVTPLFRQANTGINIFDPYRGGEAAFLWTQMLRAFRTLYGCDRFIINAYQFGAGNAEAIQSGAFWFYYRLGFRPGGAATRGLAAREAARMAADRGYRSDTKTLRALATGDLYLDMPGFVTADHFDEALLPQVGAIAARQISRQAAGSRIAALRQVAHAVARDLGIINLESWSPGERRGFDLLAPVVGGLPGLRDWPVAERAALVTMMHAKGGPQERDFALAARAVPRVFHALAAAAHAGNSKPAR